MTASCLIIPFSLVTPAKMNIVLFPFYLLILISVPHGKYIFLYICRLGVTTKG